MEYGKITFKCDFYDDIGTKIRTRELLGTDFFVLPAVMMVEGAYYPSIQSRDDRVALYFSSDELEKSINSWNGRGISLMHPDENSSFNVPDVFNNHWLGYVFNTKFEPDKKRLVADLWISSERGNELVSKVKAYEQVDLSIGACGELIASDGVSNGVKYTKQFINIVGDHLAVLPDVKGACSWNDGCGIRANEYGLPKEVDKGASMPKKVVKSIPDSAKESAINMAKGSLASEFETSTSTAACDKSVHVVVSDKGENMDKVKDVINSSKAESSLESFVRSAPEEYRSFLMDAVLSTNARRNEMTKEILDFKEVTFCSKFLEGTSSSDLEAIVATTRVADKYRVKADEMLSANAKNEDVAKKNDGVVDFSVNGFSESVAKERYMPIRKINFAE